MKLTKRIISVVLAVVMLVCMSVNSYALGAIKIVPIKESLKISTLPVPQTATEYAINIFNSLHAYDFKAIGLNDSEIINLSISPGFCAVNYYTGNFINDVFYFLIKSQNSFVASLVVNSYNGTYGFKLSKSDYADEMNAVSKSSSTIYNIVVTENARFCWSPNGNAHLLSESKKSTVSKTSSINFKAFNQYMNQAEGSTVDLFDSISEQPKNLRNMDTYCTINVPGCDNFIYVYGPDIQDRSGTCWASVAASIITYLRDGDFSTRANAESIRNTILDMRYTSVGNMFGTADIMTSFIHLFSGFNYVTTGSTLSFSNIATLTYTKRPSSIIYWPVVGNEYHAVVLAGFSYLSSDFNNVENQAYYIMDPNHPSSYIMVGYNTAYVDNDILEYVNGDYVHPIYLWSNTAVRYD